MDQKELDVIVAEHKKWLEDSSTGKRANLQWANLRNAYLLWADLQWADLQWADLRGAKLRDADLRGADLWYADLRYAGLQFANFRHSKLYKTYVSIKSTYIYFSFKPVTSYHTYTEQQQVDLINDLLEHVYMCKTGE